MDTSELIATLAIAMVCNDMPSARRALEVLSTRLSPQQIGSLLARLEQMRAPVPEPARLQAA